MAVLLTTNPWIKREFIDPQVPRRLPLLHLPLSCSPPLELPCLDKGNEEPAERDTGKWQQCPPLPDIKPVLTPPPRLRRQLSPSPPLCSPLLLLWYASHLPPFPPAALSSTILFAISSSPSKSRAPANHPPLRFESSFVRDFLRAFLPRTLPPLCELHPSSPEIMYDGDSAFLGLA